MQSSSPRFDVHPLAVRLFHWVSVLLLLGAFTLVLSRELLEDDGPRATLLDAHRWVGLLVGGLTLVRALNRWRSTLADTIGHCPLWQRLMAHGLHGALYVALLALPLLGWALTNARGHAVPLPLGLALPNLIGKDLDLADTLEDAHAYLAWGLAAAVGMHVAAALLHHLFHRDGVLHAMVPALRPRRP